MRPKNCLQQNFECLEQQIYASQENFTQPLVAMVETFRRSALEQLSFQPQRWRTLPVCHPALTPGNQQNIIYDQPLFWLYVSKANSIYF